MPEPRFSVCLLAHNSAAYIASAIESVLAQSYPDWEMLVSDDASSDGTAEAVQTFLSDSRIRYVRHDQNLGQPGNWSYAIRSTGASLIATLHADDVWTPKTLDHYLAALDGVPPADMVWGSWVRTNGDLKPLVHQVSAPVNQTFTGPEALIYLLQTNLCLPSALAFRRSLVERSGLPNVNYGMLCDREYALRLAKGARCARTLTSTLVSYRVHSQSVTTAFTQDGRLLQELDDFQTHLPQLLKGLPSAEQLLSDYNASIGDCYFRMAVSMKIAGNSREAGKRLRDALLLDPRMLRQPKVFIKWVLFHCGRVGARVLRRIEQRNAWINHEAAAPN